MKKTKQSKIKSGKRVPGTSYMRSKATPMIKQDLTPHEVDQIVWAQSDKIPVWNSQFDLFIHRHTMTLDQRDRFGYPTTKTVRPHTVSMRRPTHFAGNLN